MGRILKWLFGGAVPVEPSISPHQRWPEILDWRAGDEFDVHSDFTCHHLVSITEDGYAVIEFCGQQQYVSLSRLVGRNASARTRRIGADLKRSNDYMELLNQFHVAVDELQARDRKRGIAA